MARPRSEMPSLRPHMSGQAIVRLNGRDFYLGRYGSPESLARYAVLIAEYQANGMSVPAGFNARSIDQRASELLSDAEVPEQLSQRPLLLKHVTAAYHEFAKSTFCKSPAEVERIRWLRDELDKFDGNTIASTYGPKALRTQRDRWGAGGNKSRGYCNRLTRLTVRMFRWAVSEEMIAPEQLVALASLSPLREGQTKAYETDAVRPVPMLDVRKTAKELAPIIKAMLRIQLGTGMRPSEIFNMRPMDIDRTGPTWIYRPPNHKNQTKGKTRAIPIVGDARDAIIDYLNRPEDKHCFSPKESVAWHKSVKRANRKTKVQPSQKDRSKPNAKRKATDKYSNASYRRAIVRACERAGVKPWFPYQIRHAVLTLIRDEQGPEAAQALAGHSRMSMTEHYAKLSESKAIDAARHAPTLNEHGK